MNGQSIVLPAGGADNTNNDKKFCVPAVTLSGEDNEKLSKPLSKWFERSANWYEYKTNNENKNTTNEYRCFIKSNFVGINRLFILVFIWLCTMMKKDLILEDINYQKAW